VSGPAVRLAAALAERYRIERENRFSAMTSFGHCQIHRTFSTHVASPDGRTLHYGAQQSQANIWLVKPSPHVVAR